MGLNGKERTNLQQELLSYGIVFFDDMCYLCHWFVRFLIRYDKNDTFRFSPLHSEKGQGLLCGSQKEKKDFTTVLFKDANTVYSQSDAVLAILRNLGGIWRFFYLFILVPKSFR